MPKRKLIRITTVPLSLEKLLEGQLAFMSDYYEVTAVSSDKNRLQKYGKEEGVAVFHLELTRKITPLKDFLALYKLIKFLRKEKPQIVHTHTPKAGIIGMMAAYFAKVPLRIHTVAGLPLMEASGLKRKVLNFVEKRTYKYATHVYPNSRGLYDFVVSEGFITLDKLGFIGKGSSNGIDTNYFNPELYSSADNEKLRNDLSIPITDFVFVFVGRLVTDKGVNELVTAFVSLQKKYANCSLLLVGSFEAELDRLERATCVAIDIHSKIYKTGYQIDVRPYFVVGDALVFPSYREGFPNVVLQAGAMRLPAIVSNINGCNEIIRHEINGFLIPSKNSDKLEEAMEKLIRDTKNYESMEYQCRSIIKNRYERSYFWAELIKEYKRIEISMK